MAKVKITKKAHRLSADMSLSVKVYGKDMAEVLERCSNVATVIRDNLGTNGEIEKSLYFEVY